MRKTQKQLIKEKLKYHGYVDNFWCLENKVSVRLGAIIHQLKQEGWKFDEVRTGYVPGTKNWRYYLAERTERPRYKIIERDGQTIAVRI